MPVSVEDQGGTPVGAAERGFRQRYGRPPEWIVAAPGRVNLLGEHTDYNDGYVLPMAIDKTTVIAGARSERTGKPELQAFSARLDATDTFAVDSDVLEASGIWTDYIKGVLVQFLARGLAPTPLDLYVDSDLPMGCGLSSSAALQIAAAVLLRQLNGSVVKEEEIAELCQAAEHAFAGVPVGIMDQFCIAYARSGHLVYLDCRSITAEHVRFDDEDVAVLIVDSRVERELRSGAYAARRSECAQAAAVLGVAALRDATPEMVVAAKHSLGETGFRRAHHVTSENARTKEAVVAVKSADWSRFGALMYQSHESMSRDFEMSCTELDFLVDAARDLGEADGVLGARMTGGGFGGCVVSLIRRAEAEHIIARLARAYRAETGLELRSWLSSPAAGARVIYATEKR